MTDDISPELFAHLAELAALELAPEESEYLRGQMNNQLKAIHELVSISIDSNTDIASHGVAYTAEFSAKYRGDEWNPHPNPGKLLAQAPEVEDGYIIVPEIPHKDLE
jgi:aspartyl/glutamyl-tRNA(Asn/Gln) amidotransferase C subunit